MNLVQPETTRVKDVYRSSRHTAGLVLRIPLMRYFVGPFLLALGTVQDSGRAQLLVLVAGGLVTLAANVANDRQRTAAERGRAAAQAEKEAAREGEAAALRAQAAVQAELDVDGLLDAIVTAVRHKAPHSGAFLRANVMLPVGDGNQIGIVKSTAGYPDPEIELTWGREQGCAGSAWARGRPYSFPSAGRAADTWGLTSEQKALTAELGMIVSVPLLQPSNHARTIGSLSIDDTAPRGPYHDDIESTLLAFAPQIARKVLDAGLAREHS